MAAVADRLRELIHNQLGEFTTDEITDLSVLDDLGMDSLDIVELVMAIEEEYTIAIEDDEVNGLYNFGDMVRLIESLTGNAARHRAHNTEEDMARTRRQQEARINEGLPPNYMVQSDTHFAGGQLGNTPLPANPTTDFPYRDVASTRAKAEGAAEVMGTTPEMAADVIAQHAATAASITAAQVITQEMAEALASEVTAEIVAAAPRAPRRKKTPTLAATLAASISATSAVQARIRPGPVPQEATALQQARLLGTPEEATTVARLQANALRRRKAAARRAADELRIDVILDPLPVDATGFPAATLTTPPGRRGKKVVDSEGYVVDIEVVDADVVAEAVAPVEAPVEETPEQKQTRNLIFDPFTLEGTEENPIFLVDVEQMRGVFRYDREDSYRRRLAVCRGQYDGRAVYSFTKEKLLQFTAGLKKIVISRHGTSRRHVELVRVGARTRMPPELTGTIHQPDFPEYQIEDFAGRGSAYSAIAAAILGPVLRRKVIFVTDGVFNERGGFQIYVAHNIHNRRVVSNLRTIFGIEDHNDYPQPAPIYESEHAVGTGSVIFIQDQGVNVAELHPNGLMILANLRDDFFGIRIFHRILTESVRYLADPAEYERLRVEMSRRFRESQQEYIVGCATRALEWVERNMHDGADRSANGFRSVTRRDHLQEQIRGMERQLGELNLQLFAVSNTNQQATMDRIRREFDFLADGRFAMINKIHFSPDGDLHIITDPIVAYDRQTRKYHLLGPCESVTEFPGKRNGRHFSSSGGVRLLQHVQPGHNRLALPHCDQDGRVCWGNISNEITALVAGFELQALASLVITFLQRPNPFDRDGRRVRQFPETAAPTGHDPTPVRESDRAHEAALNL